MDRTPLYEKIIKSLKVTSKKVIKKALGNCSILDYRQPNIPNGDVCKYHVCVEIAHKQLDEAYSREAFLKVSGTTAAVYQETFGTVCAVLQVVFEVSLEELATKMELSACAEFARVIIEHFKTGFSSRTFSDRRADIKHNETALACGGLALAAEAYQMQLDSSKMLQLTAVPSHLFETTRRQMRELTIKLGFPSGSPMSAATESETLGGAPATKKHKGANGAILKGAKLTPDNAAQPPKITLDMPVDKELEAKIKEEDEKFVAKLMKVSMLAAAATSVESKSQSEKIKEDDERFRKWRESVITKSAEAKTLPAAAPTKQSTINFARAPIPSSSSAPSR